jgi:hypothetical protein
MSQVLALAPDQEEISSKTSLKAELRGYESLGVSDRRVHAGNGFYQGK